MTRIEYNLLNLIGKFVIKRKKIDSSRIIRYIRRALLAYIYTFGSRRPSSGEIVFGPTEA